MDYRHTQKAYQAVILGTVGGAFLLFVLPQLFDERVVPIVVAAVIVSALGLVLLFGRLTVVVAQSVVTVAFGFGWPRRTTHLADITAVRPVRNTWYHGWGIRLIKDGWMYNVWGLDAIELDLSSGKKFRIGTDDPEGLLAALTLSMST